MHPSQSMASITNRSRAFPVSPCAIGISQLRIIFRCGNGNSGAKGLAKEGSDREVFRWFDIIRTNKLGANDSLFRDFMHDVGQKTPKFGAPGRNRTYELCRPQPTKNIQIP